MELAKLEEDFLGDLSQDVHGVWEVFEFVRLHTPGLTDEKVFEQGVTLINRWFKSGWIAVSDSPVQPSTIRTEVELKAQLSQVGSQATRYFKNAPSIEITDQAYNDITWLRGAS
jgi:hypothetical protein